MKIYKVLNIKGTPLEKEQLDKYMENIASDHILSAKSSKNTYPINRLEENYKYMIKVYNLLNEHIKIGINIHPAGEWLLDNFYIIEETVKTVKRELSLKKYLNFPGINNGTYKGFARIYVLASEIVAYTDGLIDSENLKNILSSYQNKKTLAMEEIWNIGIFIQISIIEKIREICEKIYSVQIQKYKVENIVERLVENKENKKFIMNKFYNTQDLEYGDMKYPFIEHMSYRLKLTGKKGYTYLTVLEEQVNKMGTTISEIIKKEHFEIALRKVKMGNLIRSIKNLLRIDFLMLFEEINGVEEVLKQDPANVYANMDFRTKTDYRNAIKELSKKTKISEIYIVNKALELSKNSNSNNTKKSHIGYYLIAEGREILTKDLLGSKESNKDNNRKMIKYIFIIYFLSFLLDIAIFKTIYIKNINLVLSILLAIISYIPISEIIIQVLQYVSSKLVKQKHIPKLDYYNGVPKKDSTFVVIPTIINSKEKVEEMLSKLEVYYLANKSDNIYFALLGDCTSSIKETEKNDNEIINKGKEIIKKLNEKYKLDNFARFHFLYRKRRWNEKESAYIGWERKRGLLNQFNGYLLEKNNADFIFNSIKNEEENIPKIKYIITLDSDTELILNSGLELIGAMSHILNKPEITNGIVTKGHALLQPRIGINLDSSNQNLFTKVFAPSGGVDIYANAISDFYQDNFDEGIFTGKGIYDLEIFNRLLKNEIPNDTILSHDLLEGSYLRCGLLEDVLLMDGCPNKYNAFMNRLNRWIRGDWQIIYWLKRNIKDKSKRLKVNPLNLISKYKIFDNLRRSILEVGLIILYLMTIIIDNIYKVNNYTVIFIIIISAIMPFLIDLINAIVFKKEGIVRQKTFENDISGLMGSAIRSIINLAFLPYKAIIELNAIIKSIYRMKISKRNLLEWMTSEEAEKSAKNGLKYYYKDMFVSVLVGILPITIFVLNKFNLVNSINLILGLLWVMSPYIAYRISINNNEEKIEITEEDKKYINEIGYKTWQYFKENMNERTNFLPPDNYQEDRKNKIVFRTSSTNIGLGLISIISAYDLKYENLDTTIDLLEKVLQKIKYLEKWNGHLYNWYNIETLTPLIPRYVSTVDSGNFIGYMFVVKAFLVNILENIKEETYQKVINMIEDIDKIIINTNFSVLYDNNIKLFSIGFNVEENKITDSYYDLLASEARQASLIAIAKKDVPAKHWNSMSRTLTPLGKYKGLVSWAGTAFEYLMPNINIKTYKGSLLNESCMFMIMSQKEYAKKIGIPWGISESAYNVKDLNSNYQYKAFGIPWLGLKRGLEDETVVSGYGSILALSEKPKEVTLNIKELEKQNMMGKYGIYESIDYTNIQKLNNRKGAVVKTFMAHHQGLIIASINNFFNDNIIQNRFHSNPEIKAVEILLQEKMPENLIITKEKKEKLQKLKYKDHESYTVKEFNEISEKIDKWNFISNEDYLVATNTKGESYSKFKDIYINRFKYTDDLNQGTTFFIKNLKNNKIWSSNYIQNIIKPDKYKVTFKPESTTIYRKDGDIESTFTTIIAPKEKVEIRNVEIKNNGSEEQTFEIYSFMEPILSTNTQDYSHRAFNNLFLNFEYIDEIESILVKRKKRDKNQEDIYLCASMYTEDITIGEIEYEIDKEKFYGRGNFNVPYSVKTSKSLSKKIGLTTDPSIIFKRSIKIKENEKTNISLIYSISNSKEETIENIKKYRNKDSIENAKKLSKAKIIEESRYLGVKGVDVETYKLLASYLIVQNPMKSLYIDKYKENEFSQSDLWKFGISGDIPILLVKIKDVNDIYVVKEVLKAYEFLKLKNIKFDLIILDDEKYSYEQYVREEIETVILNKNLGQYKNAREGIFVLNSKDIDDKDINSICFRANLIIDSHLGSLVNQLNELENEYLENIKDIENEPKKSIKEQEILRGKALDKIDNVENLKYYNEYGAFSNDGKEYIIKVNKDDNTPTVWSHIIANKHFGSVLTEGMGGFTWKDNSRLNRITAWNNNPILDIPSEIIYLKDQETGNSWSMGLRPKPDNNDYYITYGFGYARYEHTSLGVLQKLETFIPINDNIKVNIIEFKNTTPTKKKLKLIYYLKPVLDEDEIISDGNISVSKENNNIVIAKNLYSKNNNISYIACSEKIKSFTGNKQFFIGKGDLSNPDGVNKISLDNNSGLGLSSCIAIQTDIELEQFENKKIVILLGQENEKAKIKEITSKYLKQEECELEFKDTKKYWFELIDKLQVKTPIESMNIILNGWTVYQTIASRIFAKSGYYQSGGAIGFRDQLQDTLGMKYIDINLMKEQIIKASRHQFKEGDVLHWWHEEDERGIRTRFSDDLLWLPYVVYEYIKYTSDESILDIQTNYLEGKILEEGIDEKYDHYEKSNIADTIYKHCISAIEKSINFGENGLPKIGSGDWNDGFSNVGNKGKGESVWLGFFFYEVLNRFIQICTIKQDFNLVKRYEEIMQNLKKSLNTNGWDGRWFKRAFTDDGAVLGSMENSECKIDNISQSWSVISNAADNDKKYIAMESLENNLVDKENGVIKLLDPPFQNGKLEPGYIKSYLPGVRENGGQYTHGAIWAIIAQTILGFGEKAVEYFKIINPIEHSRTKEAAFKYKVEPYVVAADVYASGNLVGRGGWTWYTGSSSWLYKAGIENIIGFKIQKNKIYIEPCIPTEWKEYDIRYRYNKSIYNIKVKNPNGKNVGTEKIVVDGKEIKEKFINLVDDNNIHSIEILM